MRRRKINAGQSGPQWLDYGNAEVAQTVPVTQAPKGVCRHCGEYVGRGLHFHERSCGHDDARNADR